MTLAFAAAPDMKVVELGGGDAPQPITTVNIDCRPGTKTHIVLDFNQTPWPLQSDEWDGLVSVFCVEHISYRNIPAVFQEIFRIIKPGAKSALIVPNTEEQLKWVQAHPDGWDGKGLFESASELLFGSQDYAANAHCCFFSPNIITALAQAAGFTKILIQPYGERSTDMCCEMVKPEAAVPNLLGSNVEPMGLLAAGPNAGEIVWGDPPKEPERCFVGGPGGAVCLLPKGHPGNHRGERT